MLQSDRSVSLKRDRMLRMIKAAQVRWEWNGDSGQHIIAYNQVSPFYMHQQLTRPITVQLTLQDTYLCFICDLGFMCWAIVNFQLVSYANRYVTCQLAQISERNKKCQWTWVLRFHTLWSNNGLLGYCTVYNHMWILPFQRSMLPPFIRVNYTGSGARIFTNQNQRKGRGDRPFTKPTKLGTFKWDKWGNKWSFFGPQWWKIWKWYAQCICEVPFWAVLVGKWEINSASSYSCRQLSLFHFQTVTAHPWTYNKQTGLLRYLKYWFSINNSLLACYISILQCKHFQNFLSHFKNISIITPILSCLLWLPAPGHEGTLLIQNATNHLPV